MKYRIEKFSTRKQITYLLCGTLLILACAIILALELKYLMFPAFVTLITSIIYRGFPLEMVFSILVILISSFVSIKILKYMWAGMQVEYDNIRGKLYLITPISESPLSDNVKFGSSFILSEKQLRNRLAKGEGTHENTKEETETQKTV